MSKTNAAAATNNEEIKFRSDFTELEEKLKPSFSIDKDTDTIVLAPDAFFKNAPEGMTEETYGRDRRYTDLFANVATKISSELAVEAMKKKKDLQQVTISAPIYKKDTFEATFKRSGTSRNVKTGEVSNYVGAIGVGRINVVSTRTQAEWTNIKNNMKAMAEAAGL